MTSTGRRQPSAVPSLVLVAVGLGLDALASWTMAQQSYRWLPVQASTAAPYVDNLFALETGIGSFILVGCTAVIAWTLLFNRAPKYDLDDGDPIEGNIRLEIIWTLIPLVVVLAIAWHTIGVNHTLATLGGKQRLATAAPLESASLPVATDSLPSATDSTEIGPIQVIGRQWSWEFIYPNGVRSSELHLPVDRPIYFRLISMDVLHGFYIPAFRLKQDLIPGSVIDYRLTPSRQGRYRLRDSMFSGGYFATNQTDVVVESGADFAAWLAAAEQAPLRPSFNEANDLWQQRLDKGNRGWATVPPAPPPEVNVSLDPQNTHEA
ncbi:MAG: cytochrome c oxidase subunit II [Cyanobacteriota bacterium]|nr:cytochrome c oxidase subunit II [Cyanobium sp. 49614_E6]